MKKLHILTGGIIIAIGLWLVTNSRSSSQEQKAETTKMMPIKSLPHQDESVAVEKGLENPPPPQEPSANEAHSVDEELTAQLIEERSDGVRVYRVGEMQINVTPDGSLFFLPDYID